MANSLEARSPFLDTALVEYAATIPDALKLRRGRTKIILRDAFADLLPKKIITRVRWVLVCHSAPGFGRTFESI
ncbi:MAG: hypothetical protein Ct9H300mP25_01630 [Acidobacteriota bacterium]|nr:MAG: hypothetical protein Ct9H300mP25_01630 [Acidobacteriota bacterium]